MASESLVCQGLTSMTKGRVFASAAQHKEDIYVLGGCGIDGVALTTAEVFHVDRNSWDTLPPMPTVKAATKSIVVDDKILTLGGISGTDTQVAAVEAFDPSAQVWITLEPFKEPLQGMSAHLRGDKVLVVGGMTSGMRHCDGFYCLDIRRNKWQCFPSMPTSRYSAGTFFIDDILYVLGGRQGRVPTNVFESFDMRAFKWRDLPVCPGEKRVFNGFINTNEKICMVGGLREDPKQGFSGTTDFFEIASESWETGPILKKPRGDISCGVVEDHFVVAGGFGSTPGTEKTVEVCPINQSNNWVELKSQLSGPYASCAHTIYTGTTSGLFLFGGMTQQGCSATTDFIGLSRN